MKKLFIALMMAGVLVSVEAGAATIKPQLCPVGHYSAKGASRCTKCDAGYIAPKEGSSSCTKCKTGQSNDARTECTGACATDKWLNGAKCAVCPLHAKCDGLDFTCNSGYYKTSETATTCTSCPAHSTCTNATTFTCDNGYFKNSGKCIKCDKDAAQCGGDSFVCKDGFYEDGTGCKDCPAGSYCKH